MPPPSGAQKVTPQLYPSLAKASSKGENEGGQTARRGTRRGAGREEKGGREGMSVIFSQSNNRANSFLPYPPMFFSFPPANRGWLVACVALHSNPGTGTSYSRIALPLLISCNDLSLAFEAFATLFLTNRIISHPNPKAHDPTTAPIYLP